MRMIVKCLTGGFVNTNCYIVACEETMDAMVIDPGFKEGECTEILSEISTHNLKVKYIVNTHG
ncbi:MAG: MBL fold metallo-hydrolase, partial [Nitrososphaeria archaeon]|nr:MBL fold metallo-hydrolase [Nitrososphaeria archaeon]